jgi:hypothetical protein
MYLCLLEGVSGLPRRCTRARTGAIEIKIVLETERATEAWKLMILSIFLDAILDTPERVAGNGLQIVTKTR